MSDTPKSMRLAKELVSSYIQSLDDRHNGVRHHIPCGFPSLDKTLPGWLHKGHLIIVAGRPAMGKSVFAQQVTEQVAGQGHTSIFYTLEMGAHELTERGLSRRSGVPIPSLKTAESLTQDDWRRLSDAMADYAPLPLLIDDAAFDINALVHKTKAAAAGLEKAGLPPLGLVTVDYLQLVGAKAANRTLEVGQVTSSLKRLAKELSVPVLALSQLSRGVEGRQNRRPTLSDLRESGNIEQDADLVLFLYRDEYYDENSPDKGVAEVIAAKNRHGSTGTTRLAFVGERVTFGELAHGC